MVTIEEEDRLKRELLGLFGHMTRMRRELATLHGESSHNFATMSDTLDAIVENTEAASNTILESMEEIEAELGSLRKTADETTKAVCDRIGDRINQVFEACSFQDLTGQRITRVVNALKFVEEKVNSMRPMPTRRCCMARSGPMSRFRKPTSTKCSTRTTSTSCSADELPLVSNWEIQIKS
jgi:chemotaxis protein CheZ